MEGQPRNLEICLKLSPMYITPDRMQTKMLLTMKKIARNSFFQFPSKTLFLTILYLHPSMVLAFSIAAYLVCTCNKLKTSYGSNAMV